MVKYYNYFNIIVYYQKIVTVVSISTFIHECISSFKLSPPIVRKRKSTIPYVTLRRHFLSRKMIHPDPDRGAGKFIYIEDPDDFVIQLEPREKGGCGG